MSLQGIVPMGSISDYLLSRLTGPLIPPPSPLPSPSLPSIPPPSPFLQEYVIHHWLDTTPRFHNQLVQIYQKKVESLLPQYKERIRGKQPEGKHLRTSQQ